jgi:hypothetical protein
MHDQHDVHVLLGGKRAEVVQGALLGVKLVQNHAAFQPCMQALPVSPPAWRVAAKHATHRPRKS